MGFLPKKLGPGTFLLFPLHRPYARSSFSQLARKEGQVSQGMGNGYQPGLPFAPMVSGAEFKEQGRGLQPPQLSTVTISLPSGMEFTPFCKAAILSLPTASLTFHKLLRCP